MKIFFYFNHDEFYKINKRKRPYWINKEILLSFGDNDIYLPIDCFYTNSALVIFQIPMLIILVFLIY